MTPGFVDIHSHVLYGLDDGAKTRDESVEMLRVAEESGTAHIVATPHANSRFKFRSDVIAARVAELQPLTGVTIIAAATFTSKSTASRIRSRSRRSTPSTAGLTCSSSFMM
jgi:N-acetylglucosamine-6-phosphate deacetylase